MEPLEPVRDQDENTGLSYTADGRIAPTPIPPLAELRIEQLRYFGHWTAGRVNVT